MGGWQMDTVRRRARKSSSAAAAAGASVLGGRARVRRRRCRAGKEIFIKNLQRGDCGVAGYGMFRAACGRAIIKTFLQCT